MESKIGDLIIEENGSSRLVAPFDEGKESVESIGHQIISLEENARLRMQEGKDHYISRNGNWTREGVIYLPDRRIFLTKNSPIMENSKEATQSHISGNEYFLTEEQVEQALSDSVKLSGESIPTNRFKDNEITAFAFGDVAEQYGLFLKDAKIKEMPVYLVNVSYDPFARQMWFRGLGDRSGLGGRLLDDDARLRGVGEGAEGTAKNLEGILKEIEVAKQKNDFKGKFRLLVSLNKKIEYLVKQERYEDAHKLSIERDNLYNELR